MTVTSPKWFENRRNHSLFLFARWQQQFALVCLRWGGIWILYIFFFPGGQGPTSNTIFHWTPQIYLPHGMYQVNPAKGLSRVHECNRYAMVKCVAIGGIACTRAVPPNNDETDDVSYLGSGVDRWEWIQVDRGTGSCPGCFYTRDYTDLVHTRSRLHRQHDTGAIYISSIRNVSTS